MKQSFHTNMIVKSLRGEEKIRRRADKTRKLFVKRITSPIQSAGT